MLFFTSACVSIRSSLIVPEEHYFDQEVMLSTILACDKSVYLYWILGKPASLEMKQTSSGGVVVKPADVIVTFKGESKRQCGAAVPDS